MGTQIINIGDKIQAYTAYKSVPYTKCKVQEVTINIIDEDDLGAFYGARTATGKQVYFRSEDIK